MAFYTDDFSSTELPAFEKKHFRDIIEQQNNSARARAEKLTDDDTFRSFEGLELADRHDDLYLYRAPIQNIYKCVEKILYFQSIQEDRPLNGVILAKDFRVNPFYPGTKVVIEEIPILTNARGMVFEDFPIFRLWKRGSETFLSSKSRIQAKDVKMISNETPVEFLTRIGFNIMEEVKENEIQYLQFVDPTLTLMTTMATGSSVTLLRTEDFSGNVIFKQSMTPDFGALLDTKNDSLLAGQCVQVESDEGKFLFVPKSYEWRSRLIGQVDMSATSYVQKRYFEICAARFCSKKVLKAVFPFASELDFDLIENRTLFLGQIFSLILSPAYTFDPDEQYKSIWCSGSLFRNLYHNVRNDDFLRILTSTFKGYNRLKLFGLLNKIDARNLSEQYRNLFYDIINNESIPPHLLHKVLNEIKSVKKYLNM
jgi:hypothetical protein